MDRGNFGICVWGWEIVEMAMKNVLVCARGRDIIERGMGNARLCTPCCENLEIGWEMRE